MQVIKPQLPHRSSQDPFLANNSSSSPSRALSNMEICHDNAVQPHHGGFSSPTRSSLLKQSTTLRQQDSGHKYKSASPKAFLNSSTNKKGDKPSRPVHLPNLNLSSIKKYAGFSGTPVNPPTPLAHPPTPLAHPNAASSNYFPGQASGLPGPTPPHAPVSALRMSRTDNNGKDMLHPFALPAHQPQQYMTYNLDSQASTPLSPPPTPGATHPSKVLPEKSIQICTPPNKQSQPAPKKEGKPASIPASAKFLAEHGLSAAFDSRYEIVDELGSGGFGFVVRARRRQDGLIVAVKFIFKERIPSHGWIRTNEWNKLPNGQYDGVERLVPLEAYVLRMVRHRGVVAFLDLLDDGTVFYLVMEHHGTPWAVSEAQGNNSAPSVLGDNIDSDEAPDISFSSELSISPSSSLGPPTPVSLNPPTKLAPPPMLRRSSCDLFECIEQHTRLPEEQARFIFAQIVDVVHYLASRGISHRDIKDENIVVDQDFNVKLIDFGSAIIYDVRKPPPYHNRFFGTVNFAASEILQGKAYRAPHAEIWSLGVLLSVLLTGETPFSDPAHAIKGRISKPKCAISRTAMDLMLGCLEVDPDARLTIQQVQSHPWLAYPSSQ